MKKISDNRRAERGGAGVKLLAVGVFLFLAAHAGFNYIPTAYDGQNFKQDMETAVLQGSAVTGNISIPDNVKIRIQRAAANDNVPPNPYIEVKMVNGVVQARVYYTKMVSLLPFGLYDYQYQFDHTATPAGFLFKQ